MAKGYSAAADILTRTRDGQDLNEIWRQYQEMLAEFNAQRQPLIDLLSFTVTRPIEDIVAPGQEEFEEATEFGIPTSVRPMPRPTARAYPFKWYDTRAGYTWQFLNGAENNTEGASAQQLDNILNTVLEGDNNLQFKLVMKALFNNVNRTTLIDNAEYVVTALYNADGSFIPPWQGVTFDGTTHTHYLATGSAQAHIFDPGDLQTAATHVEHHGYSRSSGYNILILMNPADALATVATWERGTTYGGVLSTFDFIPSAGQNLVLQLPPGFTLVGGIPPNSFAGMDVIGSWGQYLVVTHGNIPSGYMVAVATRGNSSNTNVVGIREAANPSLRGVVLKPGNRDAYPLIDSFYIRGMGTGVGPRGAAAVMYNGTAYAVPSQYAWSA